MKNKIGFLITLSLISYNCRQSTEPSNSIVDEELVGVWYSVSLVPYPIIHAMEITRDGKMFMIGYQISTGKLARLNRNFYDSIAASNGEFTYWARGIDRLNYEAKGKYSFFGDSLIWERIYSLPISDVSKFRKGNYYTPIIEPQTSTLSCLVNDKLLANDSISGQLSAYGRGPNFGNSSLNIFSYSGDITLRINVNNFHGIGEYALGRNTPNSALYVVFMGDVGLVLTTDSTDGGFINIFTYDEIKKRCTGNFKFKVGEVNDTLFSKEIKDGNFSIPIYLE